MTNIFEDLFPKDQNWMDGAFKHSNEMLNSFEILRKLLQDRQTSHHRHSSNPNSSFRFLLEHVEVNFVDPKKFPTRTLSLGFASQTLTINVPDRRQWSPALKEELREEIQLKYSPILQESHIRTMVLLWKLISPDERKSLQAKLLKQKKTTTKKTRGAR